MSNNKLTFEIKENSSESSENHTDSNDTIIVDKEMIDPKEKSDVCLELKSIQYKSAILKNNYDFDEKHVETIKRIYDVDEILGRQENAQLKQKPWSKMDKMSKIKALNIFVNEYSVKHEISESKKKQLGTFLKICLERKKLASTKIVTYNKESGKITEICGLEYVINENENMSCKSGLSVSKGRFTLKNDIKKQSSLKNLGITKKQSTLKQGKAFPISGKQMKKKKDKKEKYEKAK